MTKSEAKERGEALLKMMKGKGWKLSIWENMGWHFSVKNGGITVHPSYSSGYVTYLGLDDDDTKPYGGQAFWTEKKSYADPNEAVIEQMRIALKFVNGCVVTLNSIADRLLK